MSAQDTTIEIDKLEINSWTRPMHLFVDGSEESVCGMSVEDANAQNDWTPDEVEQFTFPASNNFDDMGELVAMWDHGDAYCDECGGLFEEDE